MPIPSLPIEIVGEIVSHFRTPPQGDTTEAIEPGQALSLVCRRWYRIGQALRWRDVRIDSTSIPSLLAHFDLYPHLPCLVATLKQLDPSEDESDSDSSDSDASSDADEEGSNLLPKLLDALQELRALDLRPVQSTFQQVFHASAGLPRLRLFKITANQALSWNDIINSTFAQGFTSLRRFDIHIKDDLPIVPRDSLAPATHCLKHIKNFSFSSGSATSSNLVETILASLDPATLETCILLSASITTIPSEWLASCSNLTTLIISGSPLSLISFSTLLSSLSKSKSLMILSIGVIDDDVSYPSPVTLDNIFALSPPNLRIFSAWELRFTDSAGFHDRPFSSDNPKISSFIVQALTVTSEGDRCVEFWKESDAESGETRACRYVTEYATWNEYAAMMNESA
ncbi:hypothetical protein JCM5353_007016 [Sporobolomyces roseus]